MQAESIHISGPWEGFQSVEDRNDARVSPSALAQVRRANRCISRLYNLVLASCGLNATQYVLLSAISEATQIAQHELAKQFSVASATLSRRLSGLKRKGLVQGQLAERGSRVYELTADGRAVVHSATSQWRSAEQRLRLALGESDWNLFLALCDRVCIATLSAESMRIALQPDRRE